MNGLRDQVSQRSDVFLSFNWQRLRQSSVSWIACERGVNLKIDNLRVDQQQVLPQRKREMSTGHSHRLYRLRPGQQRAQSRPGRLEKRQPVRQEGEWRLKNGMHSAIGSKGRFGHLPLQGDLWLLWPHQARGHLQAREWKTARKSSERARICACL